MDILASRALAIVPLVMSLFIIYGSIRKRDFHSLGYNFACWIITGFLITIFSLDLRANKWNIFIMLLIYFVIYSGIPFIVKKLEK